MVVTPKAGGIHTEKVFGNCQLHVEWRTPEGVPAEVTDQNRSNSGVFFMGRYEIQVLDSYTDDNSTRQQDLRRRSGLRDLRLAPADGQRDPQARRVADV